MKIRQLAMTAAFAAMTVATVQAIPISGGVDMSGTVTLDHRHLGIATEATAFTGVTVGGSPTGSFAGTYGDSVNWSAFGWNPSTTPVTPLWSYTDFGTGYTYSFALNSVSVFSQSDSFLNLLGSGTLNITGVGSPYTPTTGMWSFTISNPGGGLHTNYKFTFANSQTSVPDGGMTLMLLGGALSGLGLIRRKLIA